MLTYIASGGLFGVGIGNGFLKQVAASESDLVFGTCFRGNGNYCCADSRNCSWRACNLRKAITTRSRSTFYSISACCAAGLLVVQLSLNIFGATDISSAHGRYISVYQQRWFKYPLLLGDSLPLLKAADERTYAVKR